VSNRCQTGVRRVRPLGQTWVSLPGEPFGRHWKVALDTADDQLPEKPKKYDAGTRLERPGLSFLVLSRAK